MVDKRLMVTVVKGLNYTCAVLMLIDIVLRFMSFKSETDLFFFLLTFYLFGFSALLILAELNIRRVVVYVEFLNGRIGKGLYVVFVGLLLFDETRKWDMIFAIVMVLVGFLNILLGCMRDSKHDYKDGDSECPQTLDRMSEGPIDEYE
jgi:drug/metabolite transporter (DMT)-like permease